MEALVRWQHPVRGTVMPSEFIPVAEETRLMLPLGGWVLKEACRQAKSWFDQYGPDAPAVSVNLSALQLQEPNLVEEVTAALHGSGLAPERLQLEITESLFMHNVDGVVLVLRELRCIGISIAIARALGFGVIAEGVETTDQVSMLQELGCEWVQGYYFARPMPPADVAALFSMVPWGAEEGLHD